MTKTYQRLAIAAAPGTVIAYGWTASGSAQTPPRESPAERGPTDHHGTDRRGMMGQGGMMGMMGQMDPAQMNRMTENCNRMMESMLRQQPDEKQSPAPTPKQGG